MWVPLVRHELRRTLGVRLGRLFHSGWSGPPTELSLDLTRRCNHRCAMCLQHRHGSPGGPKYPWYDPARELTGQEWETFLEGVRHWKPVCTITGGEPLLHAGFGQVVRASRRAGLMVQILTNGTLLADHARELVEQRVAVVIVSIDGPADVHDEIRATPGSFSRAIEGMRALVEERRRARLAGPVIGVNCTIQKRNCGSLHRMLEVARNAGADFLQFQHTIHDTVDNVTSHNELLSPTFCREHGLNVVQPSIPVGEFYENGLEASDVDAMVDWVDRGLSVGATPETCFLPSLPTNAWKKYYLEPNCPIPGRCDSPWIRLRVMPDGTVLPCLHIVAGNIRTEAVSGIWNGTTMRALRKIVQRGLLPGCARCCGRSFHT